MKIRKKRLLPLLLGTVLVLGTVSCTGGSQNETSLQQGIVLPNTSAPASTPEVEILLVNNWHPIPEDYQVEVWELPNSQKVSVECYDQLVRMLEDCSGAGMNPEVCSGFRTIAFQQELYENKVERVMEEGHSREDAENIAATEVARPGTSEHHTGLAVDIIDKDYPVLDESQEQRATQQWLLENSWRYGFVLRYPTGKTNLTGIIYEPWHYRYVGADAAKIMYEQELCLEEYLEQYA